MFAILLKVDCPFNFGGVLQKFKAVIEEPEAL